MKLKLLFPISVFFLTGCWQKDIARSYYPSGRLLSEAVIRNGILNGHSVMYFDSGIRMGEAEYKSGLLDGTSVSFYESGQRKAQAGYKDGMLHGWSMTWGLNGLLKDRTCFSMGRVIEENLNNTQAGMCGHE